MRLARGVILKLARRKSDVDFTQGVGVGATQLTQPFFKG
jgi:hypothetical protein